VATGGEVVENGGLDRDQLLFEKREIFNGAFEDIDSTLVLLRRISILPQLEQFRSLSFPIIALFDDALDLWLLLLLLGNIFRWDLRRASLVIFIIIVVAHEVMGCNLSVFRLLDFLVFNLCIFRLGVSNFTRAQGA